MKNIVLFGTGKYFENYILAHPDQLVENTGFTRILFAVDSNEELWETEKCGILIKSPECLSELDTDDFYVVICMKNTSEVESYLQSKGVVDYQRYYPIPMEEREVITYIDGEKITAEQYLLGIKHQNTEKNNPYEIGYVPGVYDLFHVGHLNLIRNSKKRCDYLIVGVLTDELVYHFKKRYPTIPYAQRAAIIESLEMVDRVVPVEFATTRKIDAWHRYHYDCHFSGDDHGLDWTRDLQELRSVGSNMEFFRYTKAISSTEIRNKISE